MAGNRADPNLNAQQQQQLGSTEKPYHSTPSKQPRRRSARLRELYRAKRQRAKIIEASEGTVSRAALTDDDARLQPGQSAEQTLEEDKINPNNRVDHGQNEDIQSWISVATSSGRSPSAELDRTRPVRSNSVSSLTQSGTGTSASVSATHENSSMGVCDADYRECLAYRNIYINCESPPPRLLRRAKEIITASRLSPEVGESTVKEIQETCLALETKAEEDIIQQLAPSVIPGMNRLRDARLNSVAGQQWSNFVPVPLDRSFIAEERALWRPKPDKVFGFSRRAFSRKQFGTIQLLKDPLGRSYVTPYPDLHFPFADVEFKSQARGGSHYIATNQAATAGAVLSNGFIELSRRAGCDPANLDYDEPQFFSITMDHQLACVNVHWIRFDAEADQMSFHVHRLSSFILEDACGLRAIQRAAKNILDWGRNERLPEICSLLDSYRDGLERTKAEADAEAEGEVKAAAKNGHKRRTN